MIRSPADAYRSADDRIGRIDEFRPLLDLIADRARQIWSTPFSLPWSRSRGFPARPVLRPRRNRARARVRLEPLRIVLQRDLRLEDAPVQPFRSFVFVRVALHALANPVERLLVAPPLSSSAVPRFAATLRACPDTSVRLSQQLDRLIVLSGQHQPTPRSFAFSSVGFDVRATSSDSAITLRPRLPISLRARRPKDLRAVEVLMHADAGPRDAARATSPARRSALTREAHARE